MVSALPLERVRADFPVLQREVRPGVPLVYLDSTASTLKPRPVIERMAEFYLYHYANIHRGIHTLAEEATEAYEGARARVARFIGAAHPEEIVFVRNATEAINLVARTWGRAFLKEGDLVLLTEMEHHANIVPWQQLAQEKGVRLEFVPITPEGRLDLEGYEKLLTQEPKLVSFVHMANVPGTVNPVAEMARKAHEVGAVVLVDGAQSVPHFPVRVQEIGADFFAFSGHKMLGPTGIGVLYGRLELLEAMPPFLGGGSMIRQVTLKGFTPAEVPAKFEAGTPAIGEAVGLAAAIEYLETLGWEAIIAHERDLGEYLLPRLLEVPGLHLLGPTDMEDRGGVFSFWLEAAHPHDVAQVLDHYGVAVRAGHHCAQPLHRRYGYPASTRASLYLYNTREDLDRLLDALYRVVEMFG